MADIAERQDGLITTAQLLAAGVAETTIRRRVEQGWLRWEHRGVYSIGGRPLTARGRLRAAVLTCGPGSVTSRCSGATLLGLLRPVPGPVEITTDRRGRKGTHGVRLYRVRHLDPSDVTQVDGLPVTTVPRTLLDLAAHPDPRVLDRALRRAEELRLLDARSLLSRARGRPGAARLRAALADATLAAPTRSELELRFLDLCRRARLPPPRVNAQVAGLEVDCFWPGAGLVVELDGRETHGTRRGFERDRERDAILLLAGLRVLRLTWRRVDREGDAIAQTLRELLAA